MGDTPKITPAQQSLGDMDVEEFRRNAHDVADHVADYLGALEDYPVLPQIEPGSIRDQLPAAPPDQPEPIEAAMQDEWQTVKGKPLPAPLGREDRRILFVAIARGVLKYLHDHQIDIGTNSVNAGGVGDTHSHHLDFDVNDT